MAYMGSWKIDDLLTFPANTHRFDTGAATDADAAPAYRVYEDETSTPILTGTMALLDSTNTAGFYTEQITLSAANGFEKGKCYTIYISAAVNSVTGSISHTFQMEAEVDANTVSPSVVNANITQISGDSAAADNLESYTDGTTPMPVNATQISGDSGAADNAEAFFDGTGYAGTNNVIPTVTTLTNAPSDSSGVTTLLSRLPAGLFTGLTNFAQWLGAIAGKQAADATAQTEIRASGAGSGTYDATTDSQEAIRDNMGTAQTGDAYARLGAPAGASVSADVAAVKTDTGNLVTRITSTLFSGITSLAEWLGLIAGKQTGNTTARNELRATGAGSGTYDETADSLEAQRDNTGTAGAGLTAIDLPDQTMNITGNITGNLSGSVGSVTGAVGSVTGNVGGNVAGSVGSVTGAVGSVTGNVGGNVTGSVGSVAAEVTIDAASKTGHRLSATGLADIRDIQLVEGYAADGAAPTLNQAVFGILQFLTERSISSTTLTVKRLDGSTTAMTFTLDDANSPTSITRAS